jgi:hypothetical protein
VKYQDSHESKKRAVHGDHPSVKRETQPADTSDKDRTTSRSKTKPTQTHARAVERFDNLCNDNQFLAELWDVSLEEDPEKRNASLCEFAERYCLDMYVNAPFMQLISAQVPDTTDPEFGYCHVIDEASEILENHDYFESPPRLNPAQRLRTRLYPVHIWLSPLATKREVLDYVENRWSEIRRLMDPYHEKAPRVRRRPQAARDQFIWENRRVPCARLAEMVNAKFPGANWLSYMDVQNILQKLMRRQRVWPHFN